MITTALPPTPETAPPTTEAKLARRATRTQGLFAPDLLWTAFVRSFVMLRPDLMWKNPVMFVVEVGCVLSILYTIAKFIWPDEYLATRTYLVALDFWLFVTVLFANFAEALAEARGKAQADSLRQTRADTPAIKLDSPDAPDGQVVSSTKLRSGDLVAVEAGQHQRAASVG